MYFMVNGTNKKSSNCANFNINASIINVNWKPDPLGYDGQKMKFTVNLTLDEPTTFYTKIMFSFNDDKGRVIGYTLLPLEENATSILDTFHAIIPRNIPRKYTVTVAVETLGVFSHCINFYRNSRTG
ncbi:31034_t:CDS:1 [Gigaspora margarita]|uniref:31034_t:CDS:1 n=1 Tax=Gigaspora margarita TaxID=4874 RepID=A0ABN7UCX4_GIGMA|nr:31034_t:CDS:1 [Gigaspora margarita]